MPEKVTGYLTQDGRFYKDFDLCRLEDARLSLVNKIKGGLKQNHNIDDFFNILHLYPEQVYEYILARLDVTAKAEAPDEPDTGPITIEE